MIVEILTNKSRLNRALLVVTNPVVAGRKHLRPGKGVAGNEGIRFRRSEVRARNWIVVRLSEPESER